MYVVQPHAAGRYGGVCRSTYRPAVAACLLYHSVYGRPSAFFDSVTFSVIYLPLPCGLPASWWYGSWCYGIWCNGRAATAYPLRLGTCSNEIDTSIHQTTRRLRRRQHVVEETCRQIGGRAACRRWIHVWLLAQINASCINTIELHEEM